MSESAVQVDSQSVPFARDDRIFLGEGLFETLRILNGKPCYSRQHWQRLQRSACLLHITFDLPYPIWCEKLQFCIEQAGLETGGIKALLSAGSADRGLLQPGFESRLMIQAFAYQPDNSPLALISAPWQRDQANPVYQVKSVNYLEAIMARRYARERGADDALFFNLEECATETPIANIFMINQDKMYTPPLIDGVLAGIIRQRILEKADSWGIACEELAFTTYRLQKADALFVCNALQGIRPVKSWDNHSYESQHFLFEKLQQCLDDDQQSNLHHPEPQYLLNMPL